MEIGKYVIDQEERERYSGRKRSRSEKPDWERARKREGGGVYRP